MNERQILMRGPLVIATLEDRKWKTRRVIPIQPERLPLDRAPLRWRVDYRTTSSGPQHYETDGAMLAEYVPAMLYYGYRRYGRAGDRLWVRETHSIVPATAYRASTGVQQTIDPDDHDHAAIYRAGWDRSDPGTRWRPSIHMPRWASRLTLEITDVRVEQLQEISLDDMRAEGVRPDQEASLLWRESLAENFRTLWDEINAKRGYGWAVNPWVWAISYRRLKETQ